MLSWVVLPAVCCPESSCPQLVVLGRLARSLLSWVVLPAACCPGSSCPQRVVLGRLARSLLSWVVLPAACCPGSSCPQRVVLGRLARSWPQDVELQDKLLGSTAASGKAALTISSCRAREYRRRRICLVSVVMTPVTPDLKVTIPCRKQRLPQTFNP